jgi:hypothetical protein
MLGDMNQLLQELKNTRHIAETHIDLIRQDGQYGKLYDIGSTITDQDGTFYLTFSIRDITQSKLEHNKLADQERN